MVSRNRNRQRRFNRTSRPTVAGVNTGNTDTGSRSPVHRKRGTDHVSTFTIPASTPAGSLIAREVIYAGTLPTLRKWLETYQQYQVTQIRFHVQTQVATNVNGGYYAAVYDDPVFTSNGSIPSIAAVQGVKSGGR